MPLALKKNIAVLLPLSALPSKGPIGDFGPSAFEFIDFLKSMGARAWHILPLNTPDSNGSPYSSWSSLALSPWYLYDVELDLGYTERVQYDLLDEQKGKRLLDLPLDIETDEFEALHPELLSHLKFRSHSLKFALQSQAYLHQQWQKIKTYAQSRGIQIIGDLPLFVSADSADVQLRPELFKTNLSVGVPGDQFNPDGQNWGVPSFNWPVHQAQGFQWWIERFKILLGMVDTIRLDHFIGLHHLFEIQSNQTGQWSPSLGRELLQTLTKRFGPLPIWAEDLGAVTKEVDQLRDEFNYLGMRIIQFGFDDDAHTNPHHPEYHKRRLVTYTGTHDNQTLMGWWSSTDQAKVSPFLKMNDPHLALLSLAFHTSSEWIVYPMQDLLGLDDRARMNTPGTCGPHNWSWRLSPDYQHDQTLHKVKAWLKEELEY